MNTLSRLWKRAGFHHPTVTRHLEWRTPEDTLPPDPSLPHLTWLGHGAFLLQWHGQRIVLDPVFRRWIGIIRRRLPLPARQLYAKPDLVLISHGHMDHLDPASLRRIDGQRIILPTRTERFLPRDLRVRAEPLALGQSTCCGPLSIHPVPARHGGWRYPWQRGYFSCGYIIGDGDRQIYCCGDSAWGSHFEAIGREWSPEIAILPIGAYAPAWFLQKRHLNPSEAIDAFFALGARKMIPCHFGTYRLSLESLAAPLHWFAQEARERDVRWFLPIGLECNA